MSQWIIREPNKSDMSFIYSSWLRSYYRSYERTTLKTIFFDHYKLILDLLLDTQTILIACLISDPQVILGYIVYGPKEIHYVFVKHPFWKLGIATSLYKKAFPQDIDIQTTHQTDISQSILETKMNLTYNPFLLFKGVPYEQTKTTN